MAKLYVGEVALPPDTLEALRAAGLEVVLEKAPISPGPNDLSLIAARPGITSALRHEVNNPLTAVIGYSELLAGRPELDANSKSRLAKIIEHAVRIRDLIQPSDDVHV